MIRACVPTFNDLTDSHLRRILVRAIIQTPNVKMGDTNASSVPRRLL